MNVGEGYMEGYLQRRYRTGIVKSLKRKWFVLKDDELRCYQSKNACDDNVEMYHDCLPVRDVQTVRGAQEQHGIEIVTKQKVYILVATSTDEQQAWIKAIYEVMKNDRPRSVSCPAEPSDKSGNRNRSSSGAKVGLGRILPGFAKKSPGDAHWPRSTFYLNPEPEMPTQTENDVEQNGDAKTPPKIFDDNGIFDTPAIIDETYTRVEVDNTVKTVTVTNEHEVAASVGHDAQSTTLSSSDLGDKMDPSEGTGDQPVHQEDAECQNEQESGMEELKSLLRNSAIMEDKQSEENENKNLEDGDEDGEPYSFDEDTEESDEHLEVTIKKDNVNENEKSAFERLQELLQG